MDTAERELAVRVGRELELAPLAGRYLDERQEGTRAAGEFEDLLGECSDGETVVEAVDLFGFIDVIVNGTLGSAADGRF